MQRSQPLHCVRSRTIGISPVSGLISVPIAMQPLEHDLMQRPHPLQYSGTTKGLGRSTTLVMAPPPAGAGIVPRRCFRHPLCTCQRTLPQFRGHGAARTGRNRAAPASRVRAGPGHRARCCSHGQNRTRRFHLFHLRPVRSARLGPKDSFDGPGSPATRERACALAGRFGCRPRSATARHRQHEA